MRDKGGTGRGGVACMRWDGEGWGYMTGRGRNVGLYGSLACMRLDAFLAQRHV